MDEYAQLVKVTAELEHSRAHVKRLKRENAELLGTYEALLSSYESTVKSLRGLIGEFYPRSAQEMAALEEALRALPRGECSRHDLERALLPVALVTKEAT